MYCTYDFTRWQNSEDYQLEISNNSTIHMASVWRNILLGDPAAGWGTKNFEWISHSFLSGGGGVKG
jgi:hypothetical protein